MATLYVENVPDDLYEALRKRAKANNQSIAGQVISLLRQNIPTAAELKKRREFYKRVLELQSSPPLTPGPFPSTEEMIREDRER
jgi:plasmid stability protein